MKPGRGEGSPKREQEGEDGADHGGERHRHRKNNILQAGDLQNISDIYKGRRQTLGSRVSTGFVSLF